MTLSSQLLYLMILAIPIASISWTITQEEVFKECREYCVSKSRHSSKFLLRKFFYLFTCEYCFSHYVTVLILFVTGFRMLYSDWRGCFIAGFSLVWLANVYMSLFARIRVDVKKVRIEANLQEEVLLEKSADKVIIQ